MEGNKSTERSDEQNNLYKALVEAYESDGETVTLKRRRNDDADKDKEPSAGPDRGSKRRREGKEPESASAPMETATRSAGAEDQSIVQSSQHPEWFSQQQKPPTLDRNWNKTLPAIHGSIHPWISELAKQTNSRSSFNELMDTPLDFSNFIINRVKVDTLTSKLLAGPTYELMKGSCKSLVELEYHLEEVFKATTDQLDWVNPEGASTRKYTTFITKMKATDYGHIKWIEDLVPKTMWIEELIGYDKHALWGVSHLGCKRQQFYGFAVNQESARDVYSKRRIIAVTELKIVEWHNYKHLDWITVRRDDDKLYKFKEGEFKRLRIQDIEDMLLLLIQRKLTNLTRRVEDLQLSVKSYQKKLNLTKPDSYRSDLKRNEAYTAYSNPRGFIYQTKDKKNRNYDPKGERFLIASCFATPPLACAFFSPGATVTTNVVNAPREPFVVKKDHGVNPPHIDECCCEYGDALDGIFCQQCTCKSCGKGAHIGYICPSKVLIISNPEPYNQTMNNELPQTLTGFDQTQTPQFPVIHPPPQETSMEILHDQENNRPAFYDDDDDDDVDYTIAITLVLSTEEPVDFLSTGDKHLDTIPATESNKVIKSSVEDLVPIPSDFEGTPDTIDDDSLYNENIEYVEASPHNFEVVSLEVAEIVIPEEEEIEDDNLREKLLNFPPSDRSDFSHEEFADEFAHIISPPKYDRFYFWNLPNPGELISILNSKIRENLSTTSVNLPVEDDYSPLLTYIVWIFLAYLTYPVIPPYLHPFGNKDAIFDPGITINRVYSFMPGLSHLCGAFKKFNTHRSHLNKWPMIINGKNIPILDVLLFHFYPP
nr:hypothetical protein [Tanacetum cinerariifolium]